MGVTSHWVYGIQIASPSSSGHHIPGDIPGLDLHSFPWVTRTHTTRFHTVTGWLGYRDGLAFCFLSDSHWFFPQDGCAMGFGHGFCMVYFTRRAVFGRSHNTMIDGTGCIRLVDWDKLIPTIHRGCFIPVARDFVWDVILYGLAWDFLQLSNY